MTYPVLALTMGDPCGIGPELIAKVFHPASGMSTSGCLVVGDVQVLRRALSTVGSPIPVAQLDAPEDLPGVPPGCLPLIQPLDLPTALVREPVGQVSARAGAAAAACVRTAAEWAMQGRVAGLVTAPLHKQAMAEAGVPYPGHTELLQACAQREGVMPPVRMMLANESLRVVLVTVHLSLRRALDAVTLDAVFETIRMAHAAALSWGMARPRIAVAGLNPHAGEGGAFGDEEIRIIAPAVHAAQSEGMDARGPFAPDTVFMRARDSADHPGEFDIVVAMTHDHGLIPVKYLGLDEGVNVTLGLPFVRSSPDHGTAFDLAGTGRADPASFQAALRWARQATRARAAEANPNGRSAN